ncbi:Regulatory protein, LuxR:Autoinducer-binding [Pararhodospirillum photometricum DSM 122]|uniref:Regulatory protein, LuxR:Autoinducer-binding n=2 Tax=Pararhodospirillum photometricum TaxID=1084 RepID=H6SP38_PARPM|nr:Regulatory protein, LuxR:Autoinducer-binding [Pararhodospirillum photometricum DSM 122]
MNTKTLHLLRWDKDVAIRHSKDPRWRAFYEALEGLGFRRNLSVPIWHPDRRQQIIVNFFSDLSPSAHAEVARHHANALLGIATAMAVRVSAHEAHPRPLACPLTKREVECLLWLASGLRSKEIAHRLGISEWTVHYHLGNSRTKLGATTNEQALCLALQKGLISP